jgi:cyclohexanone monooxygenase
MTDSDARTYDVIVVGAGFAGMYMLHRLRRSGLSVRLLEAGKGPGGVWYWNRYPGARCDVESMEYQYGFDQEIVRAWTWSERYGTQPEILKYVNFVAERLEIYRDADFETRIVSAEWEEGSGTWLLKAADGRSFRAQFCIMATGHLSAVNTPDIEGLESFAGNTYHTGEWPHAGVDFRGRNVAVIGTGSSGVQSIPVIAQQARHLFVFQRTPSYSLPAEMRPLSAQEVAEAKEQHPILREKVKYSHALSFIEAGKESIFALGREKVQEILESRWRSGGFAFLASFTDTMSNPEANKIVADFVREKIRQKVHDPRVAELLMPTDYPIGAKRPCLDTGYYETFNRPNVMLIDVQSTPIDRIAAAGIICAGREYAVDDIVFATGFDAMTGALARIDIRGEGAVALKEKWAAGPVTYLGLGTAGFPNLFMMSGPGSPSVLANCITGAEQQVEWLGDCIEYLRARGRRTIEPEADAERQWVRHVNEVASGTLYVHTNSWYLGSNIPGKPRVFMPYLGHGQYRIKCEQVAARGYSGFSIS